MNNILKILFTTFLIVVFTSKVFGSTQNPEKVIYNGQIYNMYYIFPLEIYFDKFPDKFPKKGIRSSALQRGYIATFEIKDNQLYIKDIEVDVFYDKMKNKEMTLKEGRPKNIKDIYNREWKRVSVFNDVFPNQELVKVDWFSGRLVLSYGKVVTRSFTPTFENYIFLEIENGNLKSEEHLTNEEYENLRKK